MKIVYKIFVIVLIVCIPFVSIFAATNIVLRMPDLYVYEFNKTQITKEIKLDIHVDKLGSIFSDFMIHKNEVFELKAEYQGREQEVFDVNAQEDMDNLRSQLNIILIILGAMLLILTIIYWILIANKKKTDLRNGFKGGVVLFVFIIILLTMAFNIEAVREMIYQYIFITPLDKDNVLSLLLTKQFARDLLIAGTAVATIILGILASITWSMTKPRRMFW